MHIEVSESYVILKKRDKSFVILAQAVHARNRKVPVDVQVPEFSGGLEE